MHDRIVMAHGSGGSATAALIERIFKAAYGNEQLSQMEDATLLEGCGRIAYTTDSFVVRPLEFNGGDIGRLSICGTVNDLCARGAGPKYISAGFILEEGLDISVLERIVRSMAETAREAGVVIATGDTKVIEGSGGMYINTSGIGFIREGEVPGVDHISDGDVIILSGSIGDHHAAILSARLGIEGNIASDAAPLGVMSGALMEDSDLNVHAMRDVTRGGLATVLAEMAASAGKCFEIDEEEIPVRESVAAFAGVMGLDPLYMGNEGRMVVILPAKMAERALGHIKESPYGEGACIIGRISAGSETEKGRLIINTRIGGRRILGVLSGEGLPRIC